MRWTETVDTGGCIHLHFQSHLHIHRLKNKKVPTIESNLKTLSSKVHCSTPCLLKGEITQKCKICHPLIFFWDRNVIFWQTIPLTPYYCY